MVVNPRRLCQTWWKEVLKKVKKAVVFIDNEAAECLHWNGGLFELISSGATCVKEFSSFEKGEENQKKAVFITSSPKLNTSRVILRDLIKSSYFEYCVLMTAVHPSVHHLAKYGTYREGETDMSVFHSLETDMLQWMGNMNFTVEIFHIPLFLVSVTEHLFLTPPFRDLFPLLDADLPRVQQLHARLTKNDNFMVDLLSSLEVSVLPLELQVTLRHLACSLHSLFSALDVREDIFTMGTTSSLIAGILDTLPMAVNRRKTASARCSLILVDRSLDLSIATGHSSESLLDRIVAVLPHLPGHSVDVAVNVAPLTNSKVSSLLDDMIVAPGCLAHSDAEHCPQVLEWLVTARHKDVLLGLHQLLGTVMPDGVQDTVRRVTPHALEKQVAAFKGKPDALAQSCGLLQQALAVVQALKSPRTAHLDQLLSLEKLLFLNLNSDKNMKNVQEQLRKLIQTRHERQLTLRQLLSLLIHVYSLAGTTLKFSETEERQLHDALRWGIIQDRDDSLLPEFASDDIVEEKVVRIMDRLHSIGRARNDLTKYRSLLNLHGDKQTATPCGLVQRLATDLIDSSRPDIPDLACRSAGLKELLKSGFSILLNRPRQQHPLENPLVLVYVVGGVTAQEVRLIQELVPGTQILVGGTSLITAEDIVDSVFVKDSLMQEGI
ncbi:sec1 family domain-containing protein 2 isoform X1 [Anabrus simplex]|uniref:sec1 family domain-containing protein 2 isoform X1 n=1 Tax=Anabrus simplex TaxID=316456 RepID=UPI0035A35EAF